DGSAGSQATFSLCLQQHDPAFEPFKKRRIQGKAITVQVLDTGNTGENCDVLYLNAAPNNHGDMVKHVKHKPVLTISEQPGFADQGGMIELGNHNNRLTFSINLLAAKASRLNVGFQLLSLARKVIES
ncbi:MAG: YfiR family protein, partial [Gammaproteobacteria bacterium]